MKTFLLVVVCALGSLGLNAQKFGYLNSQALIQQIPEVKEANAELETLKKQYENQGQDMVTALQTKYAALERKQSQGEIAPKQLEIEAQALKDEEVKIGQFQQEIQQKLFEKSETLLKPIRDRIQTAIDEVAAENGYAYIFDEATGVILYADSGTDVSGLVRAKLGMN